MYRYNPKLKLRARELRNNSTLSEVLLWQAIKGKQIKGYQFLRQHPIDNFIVDFYCGKLKLIIEIDGSSHEGKEEYDMERQSKLEGMGFRVLRFSDADVKHDVNSVSAAIEAWIDEIPPAPL